MLATLTTGLMLERQPEQGVATLCFDHSFACKLHNKTWPYPLFWLSCKISPVVNVASKTIRKWSSYLGVCGALPSALPHPLHNSYLWEILLDLHASLILILIQCYVDIFSLYPIVELSLFWKCKYKLHSVIQWYTPSKKFNKFFHLWLNQ